MTYNNLESTYRSRSTIQKLKLCLKVGNPHTKFEDPSLYIIGKLMFK
jgi:hypothetical protein